MKKIVVLLLIALLSCGLMACGTDTDKGYDGEPSAPEGAASRMDSGVSPSGAITSFEGVSDGGGTPDNSQPTVPSGQLTAAEWSDLENYADWLKHFEQNQSGEDGIFANYVAGDMVWKLPYQGMIEVVVTEGEAPVAGASVILTVGNISEYKAVTNAKGKAYLFTGAKSGTLTVKSGDAEATKAWGGESSVKIGLESAAEKQDVIEIMFLIDTTGSMGDEMRYIAAEVDDVIGKIKAANANATVRIALLFYRDLEDTYVTRYFDFSEDVSAQKTNMANQSAAGGGDFPEAVDIALSEAVQKAWSATATTKLIFHILDAPPHDNEQTVSTFKQAILTAAGKGIRLIPVASSGIDKETEYLLRSEAMMTGGTYTFLTNDSGIGGSHIEASVGEYTVELLNSLIVRLVNEYHSGTDIAPIDWKQEVKAE